MDEGAVSKGLYIILHGFVQEQHPPFDDNDGDGKNSASTRDTNRKKRMSQDSSDGNILGHGEYFGQKSMFVYKTEPCRVLALTDCIVGLIRRDTILKKKDYEGVRSSLRKTCRNKEFSEASKFECEGGKKKNILRRTEFLGDGDGDDEKGSVSSKNSMILGKKKSMRTRKMTSSRLVTKTTDGEEDMSGKNGTGISAGTGTGASGGDGEFSLVSYILPSDFLLFCDSVVDEVQKYSTCIVHTTIGDTKNSP
jgi:hypothetical protein